MNIEDIIEHKRDKKELTKEEIDFFIKEYCLDNIKDYQASALLMAIYLNGMNKTEIANLTDSMRNSGEIRDLSDIEGYKIDKHSTGGVGDKVSLILGPMVASCGAKLAKMSGRGLGHTGGTIDKLESIPGFKVNLTKDEFKKQVKEIGMAIIGQDKNIDPADKKLYALRDVTATVSSIPLIASSIMSKKLASGADCILLDVKYGKGAFMKTIEDAKELATTMVNIGKSLNKNVKAEVTDMNQPLGLCIGNNLEIKEVIKTLKGEGPIDLYSICLNSAAILLVMAKIYKNEKEARIHIENNIKNGKAFEKFVEFVSYQGGDTSYILDPSKFEVAKNIIPIYSLKDGYVQSIDALEIGKASMHLGGGREKLEDTIDMSAGIILSKKVGDKVNKGDLLATLYTNKEEYLNVKENVKNAFIISEKKIRVDYNLMHEIIE